MSNKTDLIFNILKSANSQFDASQMKQTMQLCENWESVSGIIIKNGLAGIFYKYIKNNNLEEFIPQGVFNNFKVFYYTTLQRNMRNVAAVTLISEEFEKVGVELCLLKGIALLKTIYKNDIGVRAMNDMDILVNKNDIHKAVEVLTQLDYTQDSKGVKNSIHHHLPIFYKKNINVELHFALFPEPNIYKLNQEVFFINRTSVENVSASVLDVEHQILHLILHLYIHIRNFRLNWVYDIVSFINDNIVDYNKFKAIVEKYSVDKFVLPIFDFATSQIGEKPVGNIDDMQMFNHLVEVVIENNYLKLNKLSRKFHRHIILEQDSISFAKFIFRKIFPTKDFLRRYYTIEKSVCCSPAMLIARIKWVFEIISFVGIVFFRKIYKLVVKLK